MFKKVNCDQCENSYDEAFDECPKCHSKNKDLNPNFRNIPMLSWPKQLALALTGYLGLNIFAIIAGYITVAAGIGSKQQNLYYIIVESAAYLANFIALCAIVNIDFKKIAKSFKKWQGYLAGFIGLAVMLGFNVIYNLFLNAVGVKIANNVNQDGIETLEATYPAITAILFGLIAPFCEELTYRVGLFSFLKRINKWLAYILAPIIFALIHTGFTSGNIANELLNIPYYLFAGFTLTFLYDHYGFSASLTTHVLNNLLPYIPFAIIQGVIR